MYDTTPPTPETTTATKVDDVLASLKPRFETKRKLGSGGFGTVYLAQDMQLGRPVAIKIPSNSDNPEAYLAEARTAAKLEHPNIVPIYDVIGLDNKAGVIFSKYVA